MKGIIFVGCSYTWGHGLWFYLGHDSIPTNANHVVSQLRFPTLVSNHFGAFNSVKKVTSGSDENSLYYLNYVFDKNNHEDPGMTEDKFDYADIDYIVLQTTYPQRNYLHMGNNTIYPMTTIHQDEFYQQLKDNNIHDLDDYMKILINQSFNNIRDAFMFYESKGIKCLILCATDDYLSLMDEYMLNRFVKLSYMGHEYDCINEMMNAHKELVIHLDVESNYAPDSHPSKKCHEIIAQAIINKMTLT